MEADEKKAPALARQGSANTSVSGPVTATPAGQEDASDKVTAQSDFHEFAKQCLCNGLSVIPAGYLGRKVETVSAAPATCR
jgi:hypothetical protein